MRNKPLPVFFFVLRMPLGRLVLSLLLAPCPVLLPSSGAVRSSLPALLAVYHGVGRDGTRSFSRYRLPALPPFACSGERLACVRFPRYRCLLGHGASASVPIVAVCRLARSVGRFVSVM